MINIKPKTDADHRALFMRCTPYELRKLARLHRKLYRGSHSDHNRNHHAHLHALIMAELRTRGDH
jgi:hypothetical protein